MLPSACSAAACRVPITPSPRSKSPQPIRFGEPLPGTAQHPAWWNAYHDPYLDNLVHEALSNNLDLRIATARVDEFAAILAGTKSQASPQIGYGLSGNRSRASEEKIPDFVDPLSTTFSTLLSASWEIDLWGRIRRETEAARANLLATRGSAPRRNPHPHFIRDRELRHASRPRRAIACRARHGGGTQEIRRAVRDEARRRLGLRFRDVAGPGGI